MFYPPVAGAKEQAVKKAYTKTGITPLPAHGLHSHSGPPKIDIQSILLFSTYKKLSIILSLVGDMS